jgi:hypothetical protein
MDIRLAVQGTAHRAIVRVDISVQVLLIELDASIPRASRSGGHYARAD